MRKVAIGILLALVLTILTVNVASALPSNRAAITDEGIKAPPEFVANLPESKLTKVVFIRYAPGREPLCNNNGVCEKGENPKNCSNDCRKDGGEEPTDPTCYGFLTGSKPRWSWVEGYYYSDSLLVGPAASAVSTWEDATSDDIFGVGNSGSYPWGVYDYVNSISFDNYPEEGVLGVTAIWYRGKNIYEYDIMFDTDFFPEGGFWAFDLPTVMLHEMGHGAGLDDLYDVVCEDEVMYGYLGPDDVKTALGVGDTTGIQILYGVSSQ